jgi:putative CocE/NonD family hydrolase
MPSTTHLRIVLLLCCITTTLSAQQLPLASGWAKDSAALSRSLPLLAKEALAQFRTDDHDAELNTRFRLQFVAGDYQGGLATLTELRQLRAVQDSVYAPSEYTQYEIFAKARILESGGHGSGAIQRAFISGLGALDDRAEYRVSGSFRYNLDRSADDLERLISPYREADSIPLRDAIGVLRQYQVHTAFTMLLPIAPEYLRAEDERRYIIDDSVLVRTRDGASVSAIVVRPRNANGSQPAVLSFTIYADDNNLVQAREIAANGYVGIVATTRGKRYSAGPVVPFQHDGSDANDVIDWISRQSWSNGSVGMLGGSYAGWTQWAAAMYRHPALKTIVPSAAIIPGWNSPLENGVYQSFQYPWIAYTTTTPLLDDAVYRDRDRWWRLDSTWYQSGVAYGALDSIDGTPNPLWHQWISHPTYDGYWQALTPQGKQFAAITIPVLTTTGYFDGAQAGALLYFREHYRYNPRARHYLLIGPWDHFGSQGRPSPVISGYGIDPVARTDITAVIYQWFDYILKGAPRPAILSDRVNYEVMGANSWKHGSSLGAIARDTLSWYLRRAGRQGARTLSREPGPDSESVGQVVDLTDRSRSTSNSIPGMLADTLLNLTNAIVYVSEPLARPVTINGAFTGTLRFVTNKRDMDIGVTLYEERADGSWFHLSYYLGRLSLARDRTRRLPLVRGAVEEIPIRDTRMISKVLEQGSRLVVLLNINQAPDSPINYGSGKDVYQETIADAGSPLQVEWRATSVVRVPVWR